MRNCSEYLTSKREAFSEMFRASGIYHVLRSKVYLFPNREYIM